MAGARGGARISAMPERLRAIKREILAIAGACARAAVPGGVLGHLYRARLHVEEAALDIEDSGHVPSDPGGDPPLRAALVEAALVEAIQWIEDRSSGDSLLVARLKGALDERRRRG